MKEMLFVGWMDGLFGFVVVLGCLVVWLFVVCRLLFVCFGIGLW